MAAYLARVVAQRRGLAWEIDSAGLYAVPGLPISDPATVVLARRGVEDAHTHSAKPVSAALVEAADLVLAMTESHARELRERFPDAADKVHVLGAFVQDGTERADLPDPFGGTEADYEACAARLEGWLERLADRLSAHTEAQPEQDEPSQDAKA